MNTPEGQKLAELLMQYGCALKMHDAEHVAGKILELLQFETLTLGRVEAFQKWQTEVLNRKAALREIEALKAELERVKSALSFVDGPGLSTKRIVELEAEIERVKKERDESNAWSEDLAKQCCEMEDALGFKNDQTDKDGAFVPTIGPWKERVRDLIAKEGELGDLQSRCDQLEAKIATADNLLLHAIPDPKFLTMGYQSKWLKERKKWQSSDCGTGFVNVRELDKTIELENYAIDILEKHYCNDHRPTCICWFCTVQRDLQRDNARLEALQKGAAK